jgi:cytochrome c oxidase subunit 2
MNSFMPLFYFNSPASQWMVSLVNLYDSVSFYLIIILTFTLWFLLVTFFTPSRFDRLGGGLGTTGLKNGRTLSHWVEFVWTVSPALLLWAIGIPSLKLLYLMDEILDPALTLGALDITLGL